MFNSPLPAAQTTFEKILEKGRKGSRLPVGGSLNQAGEGLKPCELPFEQHMVWSAGGGGGTVSYKVSTEYVEGTVKRLNPEGYHHGLHS